jgi:hypothetical protein
MKKQSSFKRQAVVRRDFLTQLRPAQIVSDAHDLVVQTVHVFDEPDDGTVAVVFETLSGSIYTRLPRETAGQLGSGLVRLVAPDRTANAPHRQHHARETSPEATPPPHR